MRGYENIGMEIAESEAEETVEEGSAAIEDETSKEDEEETDEEEKEEEPDRLSELEILPGKTAYINFYYTIDPEIEGMKERDIKFVFEWMQENNEGKEVKHRKEEIFEYAVDALNLLTITTGGEKGWVEVGKEDEMLLEFDLGQMREILDEAVEEELEKHEDDDASASEIRRASASEILVGWDDESGKRPLGKKDPAMIKKLKCEVETFGLKLNKFKAVPVKDDDNYGTSLKCDFLVSRNNLPGTYYGRVKASYEIKNRTFHTTQGFKVVVKQETGEIELTGKIGDSEIIMSGPASSFPPGDDLSLKVSEVTPEQQEKVDEALRKKAEEEGTEITQYKALDIKLVVDGEETEPLDDVQVRFKNVELEKVGEKKEEQEKPEEQSIVKRAMRRVMSLFTARNEEDKDIVAVKETGEIAEVTDAERNEKVDYEREDNGKEEAVESSENIKIFHLDEEAVTITDMDAKSQDNGDVVINTDHFSIYIVVNVPGGALSVPVTVHHKAIIDTWEFEDAEIELSNGKKITKKMLKEEPMNVGGDITHQRPGSSETATDKDYTDSVLYPGATGYKIIDGKVKPTYQTSEITLYKTDELSLPNGGGTGGIKYQIAVNEWSKVSAGGKYKVSKVTVKNKNYPEGKTFTEFLPDDPDNENETNIIQLAETGNEITIYYAPNQGTFFDEVGFHDYNVSIRTTDEKADQNGINGAHHKASQPIRTNKIGMNNSSLVSGSDRIGVGINKKSDSGIWHQYSGNSNALGGKITLDIPNTRLYNGNITFKESDPGLFVTEDIITTENNDISSENSPISYMAKKYVPDYQLKFSQKGDTYTLSEVLDEKGIPVRSDLDCLNYTGPKWPTTTWNGGKYNPEKPLYSNLFWPMDKLKYETQDNTGYEQPGITRDPLFGDVSAGDGEHDPYGFPKNDEAPNAKHNWFFGMRYDVEFSLGDYEGPMNYYFRGDDDFWLYIDGTLVSEVDLGGIHSAVGAYVDLREWMRKNNKIRYDDKENLLNPDASHTMSVFFMERGGTGSCCYMTFTLPNATAVPTPEAETTERTVRKIWVDEPENAYRGPITVKLKQNGNDFDTAVLKEPNWSFTWENLPKNSKVGEKGEHIYTIEEVSKTGYVAEIDNDAFILTNVRSIDIPVEKEWKDEEDANMIRPSKIEVQLYQRLDSSREIIPEDPNQKNVPNNVNKESNEFDKAGKITEEFEGTLIDSSEENEFNTWEKVGEPIVLSRDNEWKNEWKNKPLYAKDKDGKWRKIIYEIKEISNDTDKWLKSENNPNGWYEAEYSGNAIDGYKITNVLIKINIPVIKEWKDSDNKYNLRPNSITVELQANVKGTNADNDFINVSKVYETIPDQIQLDKNNEWTYTWEGLPLYTFTKENDELTAIKNKYRIRESPDFSNSEYYEKPDWVEVEQSEGKEIVVKLTNTLKMARLRVTKHISTEALITEPVILENGEVLAEPIAKPYKFMIAIQNVDDPNERYEVSLSHDETSGYIWIPMGDVAPTGNPLRKSKTFIINETEPMEYTMISMELIGEGDVEDNKLYSTKVDEDGTIAKELLAEFIQTGKTGTITLYPDADAHVQVNNLPEHADYFHHTYSVTNKNQMNSSAEGNGFNKKDGYYDERDQHATNETVPKKQASVTTEYDYAVAYMGEAVNGKEKKMDWGDDLNAWT